MTCGVYALLDPDTGAVRAVCVSEHIEAVFKRCCEQPWRTGAACGHTGGAVKQWLIALYRAGKKPQLRILQECNADQFNAAIREHVKIYRLAGYADLNRERI